MGGIIVVADTHFGIKKGSISMPGYFADFLQWVKGLEEENKKVKILDGETSKDRTLIKPDQIIFLGDIIELWDSEDEAVNACVATLLPTLAEIKAEKIYILGNHDNILDKALLSQEKEYYPLGNSNLKIMEEYPSEGYLPVGDQNYLFAHGHQFSPGWLFKAASWIDEKIFSNKLRCYDIIPSMKRIGNTIGSLFSGIFILFSVISFIALLYSFRAENFNVGLGARLLIFVLLFALLSYFHYLFILIFVAGLIVLIRHLCPGIFGWGVFSEPLLYIGLLFGLLGLPKLIIGCARSLYNKNTGLKYEKQKTRKAFKEWWEKYKQKRKIEESVNVVYGHTHFLNYLPAPEIDKTMYEFYEDKLKTRDIPVDTEPKTNLVNISAWMKDIKNKEKDEKYKNVMVASFLYIDDKGCEFFGWDWYEKRIFHIPKEVIIIRRETKKGVIPEDMAKRLAKIGWPKKLIDKWQKPIKF